MVNTTPDSSAFCREKLAETGDENRVANCRDLHNHGKEREWRWLPRSDRVKDVAPFGLRDLSSRINEATFRTKAKDLAFSQHQQPLLQAGCHGEWKGLTMLLGKTHACINGAGAKKDSLVSTLYMTACVLRMCPVDSLYSMLRLPSMVCHQGGAVS